MLLRGYSEMVFMSRMWQTGCPYLRCRQTVSEGSEWADLWPDEDEREKWKNRIANLVPLTRKRNSLAQNYDFQTKKTAYFGGKEGVSSYVLTTQVLNTDSWTPQVVAERQKKLMEALIQNWALQT
ncbi:MAG: HNH endonuclease [Desulfobacterales bacterium]|nr:HNH endonuclease [Desulfobacterales bacterium]